MSCEDTEAAVLAFDVRSLRYHFEPFVLMKCCGDKSNVTSTYAL